MSRVPIGVAVGLAVAAAGLAFAVLALLHSGIDPVLAQLRGR